MQALLPFIVLLGIFFLGGYLWALVLSTLQRDPYPPLLIFLLALIFTTAGISFIIYGLGLLNIPLSATLVTALYTILSLPALGWVLYKKIPLVGLSFPHWQNDRAFFLAFLFIAFLAAAILFNALYFPFSRDDACLYGRFAHAIHQSGHIIAYPTEEPVLYSAYPMYAQYLYSYIYMLSGWPNEYVARFVMAIMSLACLPAVYLLGKTLFERRIGILAALLTLLALPFVTWASSGYVDLPMAFLFTMAALFAFRLSRSDNWLDALLLGLMTGLAAWMKSTGLIVAVLIMLWLIWNLLQKRIHFRQLFISLLAMIACAAPWYLRNLLVAHVLIPDTIWFDQVASTLANLFFFITTPHYMGIIISLIFAMGWLYAFYKVFKRSSPDFLLLLLTIPFFLFWWLFASYDPRFLVLFLPLIATQGARFLLALYDALPLEGQTISRLVLIIILLILGAQALLKSVEYKEAILQNPLMNDQEKRILVLDNKPPDACLWHGQAIP